MPSIVCRHCTAQIHYQQTQALQQHKLVCVECGKQHLRDIWGIVTLIDPPDDPIVQIHRYGQYMEMLEKQWRHTRFERCGLILQLLEEGWDKRTIAARARMDIEQVSWAANFSRSEAAKARARQKR